MALSYCMIPHQPWLMLDWRSFLSDSSDVITRTSAQWVGHYFDYVWKQPSLFCNLRLTRQTIINTPLMIIFRTSQQCSWYNFRLFRWAIASLCITVTVCFLHYWLYKIKNDWCTVRKWFRGWGNVACWVSCSRYTWPILILWKDQTLQLFNCHKCKIINCWHSIDSHLKDRPTVIEYLTIVRKNEYSHYWQRICCINV